MTIADLSSFVLAQLVAAGVDGVDGVVRRDGGSKGAVATFGGSSPVDGIRIRIVAGQLRHVRVDVVVAYGVRIDDVADDVRREVRRTLTESLSAESPSPMVTDQLTIDVNATDIEVVEHEADSLGELDSVRTVGS